MPNPTSKLNLVINGTTTQLDIHDANAVDLNSNQTVGGIKTFSNAPVVGSINLDGKTIDTDANDNMTFNGNKVDTIEEQGEGYIRYTNGLQICWGSVTWQSQCTKPWGSIYESNQSSSGVYAKSFTQTPYVSACNTSPTGTFGAMIESSSGSNTSTPIFYLCRGLARDLTMDLRVSYVAIGRWK